jgi:hypothetical protein
LLGFAGIEVGEFFRSAQVTSARVIVLKTMLSVSWYLLRSLCAVSIVRSSATAAAGR